MMPFFNWKNERTDCNQLKGERRERDKKTANESRATETNQLTAIYVCYFNLVLWFYTFFVVVSFYLCVILCSKRVFYINLMVALHSKIQSQMKNILRNEKTKLNPNEIVTHKNKICFCLDSSFRKENECEMFCSFHDRLIDRSIIDRHKKLARNNRRNKSLWRYFYRCNCVRWFERMQKELKINFVDWI